MNLLTFFKIKLFISKKIIGIGLADIIFLNFKFLSNVSKIHHLNVYEFCVLIYIIIPQTANYTSVWIKIFMAIERTAIIVFPFKKIFSRKTCKIIIACIILIFLLLASTAGFCSHYDKKKPYLCIIKGDNGSIYEFYFHSVYQIIKSTLESWLPSIIDLIFTFIMILEIRNLSNRRRIIITSNRSSSLRNQKDRQLTMMLLATSISFFLLTLPYSLFELDRKLFDCKTLYLFVDKKNLRKLQRTCLFLVDLNHSTNLIFYFICAETFRNKLNRLFMCRKNTRII